MALGLFSGYVVQPEVIPPYLIWIYWSNYFAWILRAFFVNEYLSGKYDASAQLPGRTEGEATLVKYGFTLPNGEPVTFAWTWWAILFSLACIILSLVGTTTCFQHFCFADSGQPLTSRKNRDDINADCVHSPVPGDIPFVPVTMTFKDVSYSIPSQTSSRSSPEERLEILHGIDGIVKAGRMTALSKFNAMSMLAIHSLFVIRISV